MCIPVEIPFSTHPILFPVPSRVVKLVVKWIEVMGQSLVAEPSFNKLFQDLTKLLVKDGQTDALDSLNQAFVHGYLSMRCAATHALASLFSLVTG